MNFKRGLMRCWVVFSTAWVLFVIIGTIEPFSHQFAKVYVREYDQNFLTLIPVLRANARGNVDDYNCNQIHPVKLETCWYPLARFRELYPEYGYLNEYRLVEKTYAETGRPLAPWRPWSALLQIFALAAVGPLVGFVAGALLFWVAAGFVSESPARNGR